MSTLQCAATLLLARPGAVDRLVAGLAGVRVAQVWVAAHDEAARAGAEVATALGVGVARLGSADVADLADVLGEVADAHPGETALVLVPAAALDQVPGACRMAVAAGPLDPGATVEVLIDADDRVCVRWG